MNGCEFNLINESGRTVDPDPLRRCAEAVSAGEAGPGTREINLLLCNDAAMKRYHRIYRGSDSVTDVLSFSAAAESRTAYPNRPRRPATILLLTQIR